MEPSNGFKPNIVQYSASLMLWRYVYMYEVVPKMISGFELKSTSFESLF